MGTLLNPHLIYELFQQQRRVQNVLKRADLLVGWSGLDQRQAVTPPCVFLWLPSVFHSSMRNRSPDYLVMWAFNRTAHRLIGPPRFVSNMFDFQDSKSGWLFQNFTSWTNERDASWRCCQATGSILTLASVLTIWIPPPVPAEEQKTSVDWICLSVKCYYGNLLGGISLRWSWCVAPSDDDLDKYPIVCDAPSFWDQREENLWSFILCDGTWFKTPVSALAPSFSTATRGEKSITEATGAIFLTWEAWWCSVTSRALDRRM